MGLTERGKSVEAGLNGLTDDLPVVASEPADAEADDQVGTQDPATVTGDQDSSDDSGTPSEPGPADIPAMPPIPDAETADDSDRETREG